MEIIMKNFSLSLVVTLAFIGNVIAMQSEQGSPVRQLHFNNPGNNDVIQHKWIQAINKLDGGSKILVQGFMFTNKAFEKALIDAAHKGCNVEVILNGTKQNQLVGDRLKGFGVNIHLFNKNNEINTHLGHKAQLHTKQIVLDGLVNRQPYHKVFLGSANLSHLGGFRNPQEISYVSSEKEEVDQATKSHQLVAELMQASKKRKLTIDTTNRSPIQKTPKKRRIYNSVDKDLVEAVNMRLDHTQQGNVDITVPWINAQSTFAAIENALRRGVAVRLFTNGYKVPTPTVEKLVALQNQGAEVYLYNAQGTEKHGKFVFPLHRKTFVRSVDQLVLINTANATEQSAHQIDNIAIIPQSPELYQQLKEQNDILAKECVLLQDFLKYHHRAKRLF